MKILETFDQFLKRNSYAILEQTEGGKGFVAVIGVISTGIFSPLILYTHYNKIVNQIKRQK